MMLDLKSLHNILCSLLLTDKGNVTARAVARTHCEQKRAIAHNALHGHSFMECSDYLRIDNC